LDLLGERQAGLLMLFRPLAGDAFRVLTQEPQSSGTLDTGTPEMRPVQTTLN
jgi:hypothetical protein